MLILILLSALLTTFGTLLCENNTYLKKNNLRIGIVFGFLAIFCNICAPQVSQMKVIVGLRDAPPVVAALFFGPTAGCVAGIIAAAERLITPLIDNAGASSWFRSSLATIIAALFAAIVKKYIFNGTRPALLPAAIIAGIAEVIHLAVVFLCGLNAMSHSLEIIFLAAGPMISGTMLASVGASLVCKACGSWKKNFLTPISSVLIILVLLFSAMSWLEFRYAKNKTKEVLEHAIINFNDTLDKEISLILLKTAQSIVDIANLTNKKSIEEMKKYATYFDVDEINVVDEKGITVSSTDDKVLHSFTGWHRTKDSEEFLSLLNGKTPYVIQKFRQGANNPDVKRKYVGIPMRKPKGFIQIGYDSKRLSSSFSTFFFPALSNWNVGKYGYFLTASRQDNKILLPVQRYPHAQGMSLEEAGFPPGELPANNASFYARVFGELSLCRQIQLGKWNIICVIPIAEQYGTALQSSLAVGFILLILFTVFKVIFSSFAEKQRRINELHEEHEKHIQEELNTAKSIQTSSIPLIFPPYPYNMSIDIFACMDTADEVGGDFYDFYFLSSTRLAFMIADVSGKSIPAAMFMMRAKTEIHASLSRFHDLGEAMSHVNDRLIEGNDAELFVTCWLGILNTETGTVECVNAGHLPPYIKHLDGKVFQIEDDAPDLVLAGRKGYKYHTKEFSLAKADTLYLCTDGITDAINDSKEMFDEMRLHQTLITKTKLSAQTLCETVSTAVKTFTGNTKQFDDMTQLAIVWRGMPSSTSITVPAKIESMERIIEFMEDTLKGSRFPQQDVASIMVAVDEIVSNILYYSGSKDLTITIEYLKHPLSVQITYIDNGIPFNPLKISTPNTEKPLAERPEGGIGIHIVKQIMDRVNYTYENNQNKLTCLKVANN